MSKWVLVFLCSFAANAFASPADSGRCPWKIPFTIIIHANGIEHDYGSLIGDTTYFTTLTYVDTMHSFPFTAPDTMQFGFSDNLLEFDFAPKTDSILTLLLTQVTVSGDTNNYGGNEQSINGVNRFLFKIESLRFDDTSIFSSDSGFLSHSISYTYYDSGGEYRNWQSEGNFVHTFTATSVDLSGIFRPMHYADQPPAIVVQSTAQSEPISVTSLNGILQCSFGASLDERTLEIFYVLGIKAASCSVPSGGMEAVVPHISPGFYFVRLGSLMSKVYVAE